MRVSLRQYWSLLATYLRPQRRRVALLAVLLGANIGLQLLNPQLLRAFIDAARAGEPLRALAELAIMFLGVALLGQLLSVAETYLAEYVGWNATNRLRADLALHCLRLDPSFHNAHTPGELIERVDGDVAKLGNFFARLVVQIVGNALLLIGVLALLWRVDWRVGLPLSIFAVVSLLVINALRDIAVPHWALAREANAQLFGFLEERLAGTADVRANGATAYSMLGLHQRSRDLFWKELRARVVGSVSWNASTLLFAGSVALALGLGAYFFSAGAITLGTVYLIYAYTDMLSRPIEEIGRQMQDLQQAGASVRRIGELFGVESAVRDGPGASLTPGAWEVAMHDVTFGYDGETPALRGVSFCLPRGHALGVLGRTGSGKTTLSRLLFRLYDPQTGVVRLDGVDLREPRVEDLRERIGVVTQEIQLFHASVRDNLAFFDHSVPDQRIRDVVDAVGLGAWLRGLPQGLDTMLAPGGGDISAGEAQSLAFARVFLRDPSLVILDEASSRLDPATEQHIEQAIDTLLQGRTSVIIAHRLQTVQRADMILILEDGRVLEYGPRVELARDPQSRFARLLRAGMEEALA